MRLQIYDLASRTYARERRAYHLLSAERRGASRCEKTTSIGCTIHRASEATMFLMISGDVAFATQPSSGRKGDRLRWKEPARVASLYILASCALSFSRLRRQLPPQGACRFARYSQGLYLVTIFNRRAGVLLPPIQNR